jgi:hypothetical protein
MTRKKLLKLFTYVDGTFIRNNKKQTGQGHKIGWTNPKGYRHIQIGDTAYAEHHLVWLYHYGNLPIQLDHINRIKDDNRIENLRECTTQENCRNQGKPKNNTSGQVGVSWCKKTKKWRARIGTGMDRKHLGWFLSYSGAVDARKNAEILYRYSETHGKEAL